VTLGLKGRAVIGLLFTCLCVLALIGAVAQAVGGLRTRVTNRRIATA
jgi:hypothetical protein